MVDTTMTTYQRLDYAFNNAGYFPGLHPLSDYTEEMWDRAININLKGIWLCMKYEIPRMIEKGGGVIVNTASVAGLLGSPMHYGYLASKWGGCGITKSAALEFSPQGIRVNAVCPAVIDTSMGKDFMGDEFLAMHPIGRLGKPEDVSNTVMWLCSDDASFITGQLIAVDGGWTASG